MMQRSIAIESSTEPARDFRAGTAQQSARHRGRAGELIGRQDELDRIADHIDAARLGRGGILVVVGEPGIGKTALLGAATRLARDSGVTVLWGEAKELEQRVPFAAIGPHLGGEDSAAMSPGEHPGPTAGAEAVTDTMAIGREMATLEALVAAIETRCAAGPLVLVVDDAHWADPSSQLTLRRLCDLLPKAALLIILAVRPMANAIGPVGPRCDAERLHLGPMSDSEVGALVEASLGSPAGPRLSAVVSGAGGNPLYVIELVTGLMHTGLIESGEISSHGEAFEADGPTEIRLPESLTDVIVRRLDHLPSRSGQILPMAAALGPGVEAIELSEVLGAPLIDVWNAISVAVETGILVRAGADLIFRHDLIRQVLADQLPHSTRTTLQLRAARVLMSMEAPVERVAAYLLAGHGPLDRAAVEWLVEVAERLTVRAPELATGLLGRAVETPRLDPAQYDSLRFWQVRALLWAGDPAGAESIARRVLSDDAGGRRPTAGHQLHWLLAHACFAQGNLSDAVAFAESVLARPGPTPLQQGQYHGFRALSYLLLERFDVAEEAAALAISAGDAGADPVASGLGSLVLGSLRFYQGFLGEAQELGDRLVHDYEGGALRRLSPVDPYSLSGRCLTELDRHAAAEKTLRLAVRHSESTSGVYLGSNRLELARLHFLEGQWEDTIGDLRAGEDGPDVFGYAAAAECFTALVSVHRNTYVGSPESLPAPDDGPGNRGHRHLRPWVQALVYEAQGHPDRGLEMLGNICEEFTDGLASATVYHMYPDLVRLALATGRDDIASKVAAAADALEARYSTDSRRATAALCRGLAEGRPELIDSAAESFRHAGRPWYEAQAYENLAALLAGRGLREARPALEKAIELYTGLGAEWDIARAEARLREFGIRRGRRGPRNRPKEGWEALTPTERKVAALVAQGKSNSDIAQRMFLSPRTIQSHVSSILAKLNLQSRVQIAVGMAKRNS